MITIELRDQVTGLVAEGKLLGVAREHDLSNVDAEELTLLRLAQTIEQNVVDRAFLATDDSLSSIFIEELRLVLHVDKIPNEIKLNSEEIRGPNVNAPEKALEGFIRSNNTTLEKIFKKSTEKGEFYFFKKESRKIKVSELLEKNLSLAIA